MKETEFQPLSEVVNAIVTQHPRRATVAGHPEIQISEDGKAGIILDQGHDVPLEQVVDCRELGSKVKLSEVWNPIHSSRFLVCSSTLRGLDASDILEEVEDWRGYSASFVLFSCKEQGEFGGVLFERTDEVHSGYAVPLIGENLQIFWSPGESRRYYPIGRSHPFDGHPAHEQIFFPALQELEYLLWLPSSRGWIASRLSCTAEPSPLIVGLQVESIALAEVDIPKEVKAEFPLEVRRDFSQSTPWGSRSVFRLTTKGAKLGPALLNLLDRAEADIQSATYFNRVLGMGPFAKVEHFFLIEDDGEGKGRFLPDDSVFRQPEAFEHLGIDVFLNSTKRFRPNLSQVIESSIGDRPVVDKVQSVFGAESGVICLVNGHKDGRPDIIRLSEGKPLKDVITSIVNSWTAESAQKITPGFATHLVKHIEAAASQVEDRAAAEVSEHDRDFNFYCKGLEGLLASHEANAKNLGARLSEATKVGQKCANFLSESEKDWERFADHLSTLIDDLNSANQSWLVKWEQEKKSIQDWQESIVKTLVSHEDIASAILKTYKEDQAALANCEKKVAGLLPKLQVVQKKAEQSSKDFENLEEVANSSLQKLEQRLAAEDLKVREWSSRINIRKGELDSRRLALNTRQRELRSLEEENVRIEKAQQQETATLKLKENAAEAEVKRLRHVRDHDIPRQEREVSKASKKLSTVLLEKYDDKLQSARETLAELKSKLADEQAKGEKIKQWQDNQDLTAEELIKTEADNTASAQALNKRRKELAALERKVKATAESLRVKESELAERSRILRPKLEDLEESMGGLSGVRTKLNKARSLIDEVTGNKASKGGSRRFWPFRKR